MVLHRTKSKFYSIPELSLIESINHRPRKWHFITAHLLLHWPRRAMPICFLGGISLEALTACSVSPHNVIVINQALGSDIHH